MTLYSAILFLHVLATLGLVAALSFEAITLWRIRQAESEAEAQSWLGGMRGMRLAATLCLLFLFLSGGYMTERLQMWKLAWPKLAVLIVIAFGALAGISARRLKLARRALAEGTQHGESAWGHVHAGFLNLSLGVRIGLVLAAVFLMAAKPNLTGSLAATAACILIGWLSALPRTRKLDLNRQRGGHVENRAHQQSL